MTNLSGFYDVVKAFAADHDMINQFLFVGSEEEIEAVEFSYRTFIMIPSSSNISRELNRPIYTLSFDCIIIEKYPYHQEEAMMKCIEENMFVAGQFQDFLIQSDENIEVGDAEIGSLGNDDYNVSTVLFTVDVSFARSPYTKTIIS
jgi:hypothetical protein